MRAAVPGARPSRRTQRRAETQAVQAPGPSCHIREGVMRKALPSRARGRPPADPERPPARAAPRGRRRWEPMTQVGPVYPARGPGAIRACVVPSRRAGACPAPWAADLAGYPAPRARIQPRRPYRADTEAEAREALAAAGVAAARPTSHGAVVWAAQTVDHSGVKTWSRSRAPGGPWSWTARRHQTARRACSGGDHRCCHPLWLGPAREGSGRWIAELGQRRREAWHRKFRRRLLHPVRVRGS